MKTKLKSILAIALCAVGLSAFAEPDAVQLWEGGPYFATCNVGAKTPQEYGYYFWWGDTVGYTNSGSAWVSVRDNTKSIQFKNTAPANTLCKDAAALADYVANGNLKSDYDAATAHLGAPWRMMTKDESEKLASKDYCQREWTNEYKGVTVSGWVVKGKAGSAYENNEVFFPAAGFGDVSKLSNDGSYGRYSSSTPNSDSSVTAMAIYFTKSVLDARNMNRYLGWSVRAVRDTLPEPPPPEGSEGNPWKVGGTDGTGDLVEAWTNGTGVLTVQGAGSVTNLADVIADWADIKGGITAINVASNGVMGAMAQAFAGLGVPAPVALTLPDGWQGELPDGGNWYGAKVELRDGYPLTVRNVRARQRWPWNGKVDVLCDMTGPAGAKDAIVTVKDGETTLTNFTAEVTIPEGGVLATNFVWDAMTAGLAANFKSDDVTVEVAFAEPPVDPVADAKGTPTGAIGDVMIVEIKGETWPVAYVEKVDIGRFNCDAYKTGKIVLRKIDKGTAYPVQPNKTSDFPTTTTITPKKDYYIGVFEVTEAQYDRVMGVETPSDAMTPVNTTYNIIRKGDNSGSVHSDDKVTEGSFMGILAARTGVSGFDLPTEVQWEITARAGSESEYGAYLDEKGVVQDCRYDSSSAPWGNTTNYMWYTKNNSGSVHQVGLLRPNKWGLYDTAGNCHEWCLDENGAGSCSDAETPYRGTSTKRVVHGGYYSAAATSCRPSTRTNYSPNNTDYDFLGFRLCRVVNEE